MADLSQTAANVKLNAGASVVVGTAGETLTQGQPATLSSGKWVRSQSHNRSASRIAAASC
jgi:hypothetical protein